MTPLAGQPVLTAAEVRAAEDRTIAAGISVTTLMERAGAGVAVWAARLGSGADVLVLCGPGNNGGDGYVAARRLREVGVPVRVAALIEPRSAAARTAATAWAGPVERLDEAIAAPVLIDALLGTGANRALGDRDAALLQRLATAARLRIAVDLPSGLDADSGQADDVVPAVDLTLALGALKPAHLLQPGASRCGAVRVVPIGIATASDVLVLARPHLPTPGALAHKYSRGLVAVVAGAMPGAGRLAATAALRGGAGYVLLLDGIEPDLAAIVTRPLAEGLADRRIGALVVGPGLGRDAVARATLAAALASGRPLIIDGDALALLHGQAVPAGAILTPHSGEFDTLFGTSGGSKLARTRAAAAASGAVIVHKGADTVIAAPNGRAVLAPAASPWLATAGSGDVLAGAIAASRAGGLDPFAAAQAGVWLHACGAALLGPAFVADDLADIMTEARKS